MSKTRKRSKRSKRSNRRKRSKGSKRSKRSKRGKRSKRSKRSKWSKRRKRIKRSNRISQFWDLSSLNSGISQFLNYEKSGPRIARAWGAHVTWTSFPGVGACGRRPSESADPVEACGAVPEKRVFRQGL
jgi:hypothetical protein